MKKFYISYTQFMNEALAKGSLNEYILKGGSSVEEILYLNVFDDTSGENKGHWDEMNSEDGPDPAVIKMLKDYNKKATPLVKIINKNKKVKLDDKIAGKLDSTWYDGGDAYDEDDSSLAYLPRIYDRQLKEVTKALKAMKLK